ncbi:MAG: hypothetical protein MJY42_04225 [Bacteroidales bacterium]|nr:hypothetical protein [Bacteroidales bacterium]
MVNNYGLDQHCSSILEEYRNETPVFEIIENIVNTEINRAIKTSGVYVTAVETRIKTEKSLAGKLELKGYKYADIKDVTDIVGARIITFYVEEVDKISAIIDKLFEVDWKNSVDKRRKHELNSFGYNSLHYICRIPVSLYSNPKYPQINEFRFEVQMRTALQHVWATLDHDTGYKSGVEVPREYIRSLNRLAGMLELVDEQFSLIRNNINNYWRQVRKLVASGQFEDVPLDGETFKSYLQLNPFAKLVDRIAAINQAEVHESSALPYVKLLKSFGIETLAGVEKFIEDNSNDAYHLAVYQIGNTDIDIISSTIAIQDLCIVHILKTGGGVDGLREMFDMLTGESPYNAERAKSVFEQASFITSEKDI